MPSGMARWSLTQTSSNPRSSAWRAAREIASGPATLPNCGRCTPSFIGPPLLAGLPTVAGQRLYHVLERRLQRRRYVDHQWCRRTPDPIEGLGQVGRLGDPHALAADGPGDGGVVEVVEPGGDRPL